MANDLNQSNRLIGEGEYCAPPVNSIVTPLLNSTEYPTISCDQVTQVAQLGCCFGDFISFAETSNKNITILLDAFETCNQPIPSACNTTKIELVVQVGLSIPFSWTEQHEVELSQTISTDFSLQLSVAPSDVTTTFSPDTIYSTVTPTTLVNSTIQLNANVQPTVVQTTLQQSANTMFTTTQTYYTEAFPGQVLTVYNVTTQVVVTGESVTTTTTTGSESSGTTVGVACLWSAFMVIMAMI
jgi:hypothetical protein